MPNTEVKLISANNTRSAGSREDRSTPAYTFKKNKMPYANENKVLIKKINYILNICLNSSVGFESERCRWQKKRTRKGAEKRSDGTEVTARLFLKPEEHAVTACR